MFKVEARDVTAASRAASNPVGSLVAIGMLVGIGGGVGNEIVDEGEFVSVLMGGGVGMYSGSHAARRNIIAEINKVIFFIVAPSYN